MDNEPTIRRSDYPPGPSRVQDMAASASLWLLGMIDRNDMTAYEALYCATAMLASVVSLIGREEARVEKRRAAKKKATHDDD